MTDKIGKVKEEAAEANRAHSESIESRMMEKVSNFEKQKVGKCVKKRERQKTGPKELTEFLAEEENARRDAEGELVRREAPLAGL